WVLDSVIVRLRGVTLETEQLKDQLRRLKWEINDLRQLVPVWNSDMVEDLADAYDENAMVHRQVFSMKDQRNFAGLGLESHVPLYLRAEGFVRHVYVSKAELEDFMQSFLAEAPVDLNTETMHSELYAHMQRRFEGEALTEFGYAFICGLE
ncbi:unnamed protein product, partial [Polarella glacialis]